MLVRRFANPLPVLIGAYAEVTALARSRVSKAVLCPPLVLVPFAFWSVLREQRWIAVFFAAALLLPPLPIALGDTGPHPALAIAALGVSAGLVRLREWESRIDGVGVAMIARLGVLRASVAFAALYSGVAIAGGSLARVLLFGIAVYTFFYVAYGPGQSTAMEVRRTARFLFLIA